MTTGIQQNHRPGLPAPSEYAGHVESVLAPKPSRTKRALWIVAEVLAFALAVAAGTMLLAGFFGMLDKFFKH